MNGATSSTIRHLSLHNDGHEQRQCPCRTAQLWSSPDSSTSALENCRTCTTHDDHLSNVLQKENLRKVNHGNLLCATTGVSIATNNAYLRVPRRNSVKNPSHCRLTQCMYPLLNQA